jgi:hypothetical protein
VEKLPVRFREDRNAYRKTKMRALTAVLDRSLLILGIALPRRGHDGCIQYLPAHGKIASFLERRIEAREEPVDRLGLDQTLTKQPDRGRIRYTTIETKPQEPPERQQVLDLEPGCLVGQ